MLFYFLFKLQARDLCLYGSLAKRLDGLAARDAGEEENFGFSQEFSREEKEIAGEIEGRKLIVFIP